MGEAPVNFRGLWLVMPPIIMSPYAQRGWSDLFGRTQMQTQELPSLLT